MSGLFAVRVDAAHGGRWTSLRDPAGREWLWSRPDPARDRARPGDPFVDAGGLEECFPTVVGHPDHGDVWSRPWTGRDGVLSVRSPYGRLERSVAAGRVVAASYRLEAEPGTRFVWAAHALLVPSVGLRLLAAAGTVARRWTEEGAAVDGPWGPPLDELGPDDGTAVFLALDTARLTVADGAARLHWRLTAPGQPVSVGVWRNLGGWPAGHPYRSVGVEPMIGRHPDRSRAGPGATGVVPAGGVVRWRLTVSG